MRCLATGLDHNSAAARELCHLPSLANSASGASRTTPQQDAEVRVTDAHSRRYREPQWDCHFREGIDRTPTLV